ncbi:hypothetical protein H0H87_003213 [Tephrocybe sp. NHM501043]|nr:hypothetical protein H0H87_003213 [Tephrocybe sp. NHM501043]
MSASLALRSVSRTSALPSKRAAVAGLRGLHASSRRSEQYANADLAVTGLPTVIAFHNGQPVKQFVGALNEAGVKQFLQHLHV